MDGSNPEIVITFVTHKLQEHLNFSKAWCKSGTRTPGTGTSEPWNPGPPSKFKSGTPRPPSKFKSGVPGPPTRFKSGTPSPFNEFIFFRTFLRFFYLFIFVSFLNKIQKDINCKSQKSIVSTKDKRLLLKHGARPWTLTLKNLDPEKPGSRKTWTQKKAGP